MFLLPRVLQPVPTQTRIAIPALGSKHQEGDTQGSHSLFGEGYQTVGQKSDVKVVVPSWAEFLQIAPRTEHRCGLDSGTPRAFTELVAECWHLVSMS